MEILERWKKKEIHPEIKRMKKEMRDLGIQLGVLKEHTKYIFFKKTSIKKILFKKNNKEMMRYKRFEYKIVTINQPEEPFRTKEMNSICNRIKDYEFTQENMRSLYEQIEDLRIKVGQWLENSPILKVEDDKGNEEWTRLDKKNDKEAYTYDINKYHLKNKNQTRGGTERINRNKKTTEIVENWKEYDINTEEIKKKKRQEGIKELEDYTPSGNRKELREILRMNII